MNQPKISILLSYLLIYNTVYAYIFTHHVPVLYMYLYFVNKAGMFDIISVNCIYIVYGVFHCG